MIYEDYAILDAQIKALEVKKELLRVDILKEMVDKGEDKIETGVGSFSITKLKKWSYPDYVTTIGDKFKEEKAKSESTGEATYTETESLRFNKINL